jgi:NADH-quinone oxidoreductase subunit I
MRRPEELGFRERIYLPAIVRGLFVTGKRFWRNLLGHVLRQMGFDGGSPSVTIQYPDAQLNYGEGYRGAHRLTLKDDGAVNCTACFLCATACPARCINIEAGEHPDNAVEKYPVRYEIDTLRCIYCGYCVEACPCDAIRMDTAVHPGVPGYSRIDFIEDKAKLMGRSRVIENEGRAALMKNHAEQSAGDQPRSAPDSS